MLSASKSGSASGASGYNLTRSLRFRASASAHLSRTPATATNRRTWTWSGWVKRGTLATADYPTLFSAATDSSNFSALSFYDISTGYLQFNYVVGGVDTTRIATTQVFRDPSAWYHIVLTIDTTQATAADRMKLYVNGSQITAFSYASYPSQNTDMWVNAAIPHGIGITRGIGGRYYDGYITEVNFIDGQALTPSSFGSTNALTGVWQPARYTGTYGTNGFYLPFTDNSALTTSSNVGLGKDFSGNGNYWTTNNISLTSGVTYDSMTDVPTLTSATASNFAVLNPLNVSSGTNFGFSNGNLTAKNSALSSGTIYYSSLIPYAGNYYFEATATAVTLNYFGVLVWASNLGTYAGYYSNATKDGVVAFGASYTSGDVIGVSFNISTGVVTFYKNNVSQGTQTITALGGLVGLYITQLNDTWNVNFGQQPFTYTPPTGYVALNTYNLPTSTIVKGNTVMDATLYTGNGTNQTITNAGGFKPDLVWVKCRSLGYGNYLEDSVRGVGKDLSSNSTAAEATYNLLTSFNSNGFTVSTSSGTYLASNDSGQTFVGWQWQAGQGTTSTNTNGTITSTVSVNASAGFSVVTYTGNGTVGATIGHGLGVAPKFVIIKNRTGANSWTCWHTGLTSGAYYIVLEQSSAQVNDTGVWNSTIPSSTVITTGSYAVNNASANNYVAYCWTPIAGFSAFGSYTGNGSSDGTFVYTGFRPKFVMMKSTGTGDWWIYDTSRSTYNAAILYLYADTAAAEVSDATEAVDFLSNGFKLRVVGNYQPNTNGGTFIYAAFAENPFKNSLAR